MQISTSKVDGRVKKKKGADWPVNTFAFLQWCDGRKQQSWPPVLIILAKFFIRDVNGGNQVYTMYHCIN